MEKSGKKVKQILAVFSAASSTFSKLSVSKLKIYFQKTTPLTSNQNHKKVIIFSNLVYLNKQKYNRMQTKKAKQPKSNAKGHRHLLRKPQRVESKFHHQKCPSAFVESSI
jgi:hypothetical protein